MNICPYALQSRPTRGKGNTFSSARVLVSELKQLCHVERPVLSSHIGVRPSSRRLPQEGVLVAVGKSH